MISFKKGIIKKIAISTTLSVVSCATVSLVSSVKVSASPGLLNRLLKGLSVSVPKINHSSNLGIGLGSKPKKNPYGDVNPGTVGRAFGKWVNGNDGNINHNGNTKPVSILKTSGASGNSNGFGNGNVGFSSIEGERQYNPGDPANQLGREMFFFTKSE